MPYDAQCHHRRSVRLPAYDYAEAGAYFLTLCTQEKRHLFGEVRRGVIHLSAYGGIAADEWTRTADLRSNVVLDAFVVMPNHVHGIVVITERAGTTGDAHNAPCRGVLQYAPTAAGLQSPSQTIGAIVRGYKSAVTKRINALRGTPDAPVWQRNYYEHVVRGDGDLARIRRYIADNPQRRRCGEGSF